MQELLDIQQTVRTLADQLNRVERYVGASPRGGQPAATLQAITIGGVQQPFFSGDQLGPLCFENPDLEQQFFSQVHDREAGAAGGAARSRGTTASLHPITHALAHPTPSQEETTTITHRNALRRVRRSATCGSRRWSPCSTTMRWLALALRRLCPGGAAPREPSCTSTADAHRAVAAAHARRCGACQHPRRYARAPCPPVRRVRACVAGHAHGDAAAAV